MCDTGIGWQDDPDLSECVDRHCCEPFLACFGDAGETLEACDACLDAGGGPECDALLACADDGCGGID